jgi:glutamyl-tRNA synthetase
MEVRLRMAPSPTGEYHIGHIRTAVYNYAFAKSKNGKFIIRLEDTDRERYVEGSVDRILNIITDYGLSWDEGPRVGGPFGPYIQSERLPIYKKYALELVEKGQAYYCFCTKERLTKLREDQTAKHLPVTKYDRCCLQLSPEEIQQKLSVGEEYVIRLKVPDNEIITFHDQILGDISINTNDIDDQVLLKTDGFPTYHLGVAVDDYLMKISHVMRGIDWLPSTPKHVLLYRAFGWELPIYMHLPNLKELGSTKKLSKRFGSVAALDFLQEGYLPEALVNFVMFLGWNPGTEKEIYSMAEFIKDFTPEKIHKTDLVAFDRQKLLWMNGTYIRTMQLDDLYTRLLAWAKKFDIKLNGEHKDEAFNKKVLLSVQDRLKKLSEFNDWTNYYYETPKPEWAFVSSFVDSEEKAKTILADFKKLYEATSDWSQENLDRISHTMIADQGYTPKEAFMTLRAAITGEKNTPPIFMILAILGKTESLKRLECY